MYFLLILRETVDQTAGELIASSRDPREKLAPSVMSNLLLTLWHKRPCPKVETGFSCLLLSPGTQGLFCVVAWVVVTLYQGILCFWQVPIMLWTSALEALNQADNSFYINQTTTIFNNFPSSWDWICTSDLCIRDITNPQRHSEPWLCSVFPQKLLHLHKKAITFSTMQEDADNSILVTYCQTQLATVNSCQNRREFLMSRLPTCKSFLLIL